MIIKVTNLVQKTRLDKYLTFFLKQTRNKIIYLIKNQQIKINQKIVNKPSFILKNNDEIEIEDLKKVQQINLDLPPCKKKLNIIYEDDDLLIINKPKNVLTHPTKFKEKDTIANQLVNYLKNFPKDDIRPGIVHRLDKNTTGLLLIAKNLKTLNDLKKQFENKTIKRAYLCLCHGHFVMKKTIVELPIIHAKNNTTKMLVSNSSKAKFAKTEINLIKNLKNNLALIECILHTGRTHQIRVHLKHINHQVYNDELYGNLEDEKKYQQYLHAYKIAFIHPTTKKEMTFKIDPDENFLNKIKSFE